MTEESSSLQTPENEPIEDEEQALTSKSDPEDSSENAYSLHVRHDYDFPLQKRRRKEAVVRWIPTNDGGLPAEPDQPYMAHNRRIDGKFHYIARYKVSDLPIDSFVGPLVDVNAGYGLLPVPGGTGMAPIKNYEVLVVSKEAVCWNSLSPDGSLPQRPVPGILREGGNIYVGKRDDVGVGMVRKDECWQFYSHKSNAPFTENFKVLCFVPNS